MNDTTIKNEWQRRAEARVTELSRLGDGLLAEFDGLDAPTAKALHDEATRLFAVAHDVTAALARGDAQTAYCISCGNDVNGTALGMTA